MTSVATATTPPPRAFGDYDLAVRGNSHDMILP